MVRRGPILASAADSMTLARLGFALLLVPTIARHRFAAGAWLLAAAWVSDALDGRFARASAQRTHLHRLDLAVDTTVGAGLLVGMGFAGIAPIPLALGLVAVLGGGFIWLGNTALSMALQATAYAWFLVLLWSAEPTIRWLPLAVAAALLVVNFRQLVTVTVPAFVSGMADLARFNRLDGFAGRRRAGRR